MASSLHTQTLDEETFQRIAAGVQEEMMVAMLGMVQKLAVMCAQICLERLQALRTELCEDAVLRDDCSDVQAESCGHSPPALLDEQPSPEVVHSELPEDVASGARPVLTFALDSDGEDAKEQSGPRLLPISREASTATPLATDNSEPEDRSVSPQREETSPPRPMPEPDAEWHNFAVDEDGVDVADAADDWDWFGQAADEDRAADDGDRIADEDDGEGSRAASTEEEATMCEAMSGRAGCRWILQSICTNMAARELQHKFLKCRGEPSTWGHWPVGAMVTGNASMRQLQVSAWREFVSGDLEQVRKSLLRHCTRDEEVNPVLDYLGLLAHEGPLENIPIERLEVSWALGAFPGHVALLVEQGREELANLQVLRRKINQAVETNDTPSSGKLSFTAPWEMAPQGVPQLSEWPEEALVGVGCRAAELLSLQEVLNAASARLSKDKCCKELHLDLIASGVRSPEQLLRELRTSTEAELPASAAKCRLNATLQCMGLRHISPQVAIILRSFAKTHCGRTSLKQGGAFNGNQMQTHAFLVTAPHNMVLARKSKPPQLQQDFTTCIAERLAERLSGHSLAMSLAWSRREQYRTELRWAAVKCRRQCGLLGNDSGLLDLGNCDPHMMVKKPKRETEWHQQMSVVLEEFSSKRKLHVDIHGVPDPPKRAAHLCICLGALAQHHHLDPHLVRKVGDRLRQDLWDAMAKLTLPPGERICVVIPEDLSKPDRAGAWRENKREMTQTQFAMSLGYAVAVQLEMSFSLRRVFINGPGHASQRFADALIASLTKSSEVEALLHIPWRR